MLLVASLLTLLAPAPAPAPGAGPEVSKEEALELAFPGCAIERRILYLSEEERERAGELAGSEVDSGIAQAYVATKEGALVGTAWFDVHKVRTKREVLMFVVDPESRLRRLEVLAFAEPPEYQPRASWYAQFLGRGLDDELQLGRGIRSVTGATLTARATTEAARRVLALHRVGVVERAQGDEGEDGGGSEGAHG